MIGSHLMGQNSQNKSWMLSLGIGIQEHDKRLFDFPLRENLLKSQPEKFGTYQINANILKPILKKERMEFYWGIGAGMEMNTFRRPFDYTYKRTDDTKLLRYTDRYYKFLLILPFEFHYFFNSDFFISSSVINQVNFLTIANRSNSDFTSYDWWSLNFHSIEMNSGIGYTYSKFDFILSYRFYQIKKVDRILFNDIILDPRPDKSIEVHNPFKVWLSIGYKF